MKRTLELDIKRAIELFNKGGKLRSIALEVYTEEEILQAIRDLSPLPKSWKEFCIKNPRTIDNCKILSDSGTLLCKDYISTSNCRNPEYDKNCLPSKEAAEAHLALMQLHQLRDCYRRGWKPDWEDLYQPKYVIYFYGNTPFINTVFQKRDFLSFQSEEVATEFLNNFRDLILKLKGLE